MSDPTFSDVAFSQPINTDASIWIAMDTAPDTAQGGAGSTGNDTPETSSGSWLDNFIYDSKLGIYKFTGLGTPPVVLPADSITTPAANVVRNDASNLPGATNVLFTGTVQGLQDTTKFVSSGLTKITIIAIAGLLIYFLFLTKGKEARA